VVSTPPAEARSGFHEIPTIAEFCNMAIFELYTFGDRPKLLAESAKSKVETGFNRGKVTERFENAIKVLFDVTKLLLFLSIFYKKLARSKRFELLTLRFVV